jgi:hypothetical protein
MVGTVDNNMKVAAGKTTGRRPRPRVLFKQRDTDKLACPEILFRMLCCVCGDVVNLSIISSPQAPKST